MRVSLERLLLLWWEDKEGPVLMTGGRRGREGGEEVRTGGRRGGEDGREEGR